MATTDEIFRADTNYIQALKNWWGGTGNNTPFLKSAWQAMPGVEGGFDWMGRQSTNPTSYLDNYNNPITLAQAQGMSEFSKTPIGTGLTPIGGDQGSSGLGGLWDTKTGKLDTDAMNNWGKGWDVLSGLYGMYNTNKAMDMYKDQLGLQQRVAEENMKNVKEQLAYDKANRTNAVRSSRIG